MCQDGMERRSWTQTACWRSRSLSTCQPGGVATDSQVNYMLANGSITNPANDADAAASGGAGHDEAASTRPASPQPDPVHSVHTLASGSDSLWHVHGSAPSTSDFVVVQAEVQAEAEASHAPWPWHMDRRPE